MDDAGAVRGADFDAAGYLVCPFTVDSGLIDAAVEQLRGVSDGWGAAGQRHRLENAWEHSPAVRAIACDPRVLDLLRSLLGRAFFPFQTLNFDRGSEQRLHSDFFHFGSSQHRLMVGAWVAFEDIDPASGPLVVVPGSQQLPFDFPETIGLSRGRRRQRFPQYAEYEDHVEKGVAEAGLLTEPILLRKGEVLVWAANLVHGGSPISDPGLTRMSQVTHYFGRGQTYFTPMNSGTAWWARSYRVPRDVSTGRRAWSALRP